MKILPLALICAGVLLIGGFVFIWFGIFNVAATEQHSDLTLWLISVVRDRSIAVRATSPSEPSLKDPQRVNGGFRSYHTMCAVCHSVPGHKASPTRKGLNPKPPRLYAKQVQRRSDTELYWIIKHGIRMTGMRRSVPPIALKRYGAWWRSFDSYPSYRLDSTRRW